MKTRRRCAPPFSCYPRKTAGGGGVQTPPPSRTKVNMNKSVSFKSHELKFACARLAFIRGCIAAGTLLVFVSKLRYGTITIQNVFWEK